jgi:hypothetical protein
MQDSRQPYTACWRVRSWQLRSGRSSGQYAPDGPSSAWRDDTQNDIAELASAPQRLEAGWLMAGEGDADLGLVADEGFAGDVVGQVVEVPVNGNSRGVLIDH